MSAKIFVNPVNRRRQSLHLRRLTRQAKATPLQKTCRVPHGVQTTCLRIVRKRGAKAVRRCAPKARSIQLSPVPVLAVARRTHQRWPQRQRRLTRQVKATPLQKTCLAPHGVRATSLRTVRKRGAKAVRKCAPKARSIQLSPAPVLVVVRRTHQQRPQRQILCEYSHAQAGVRGIQRIASQQSARVAGYATLVYGDVWSGASGSRRWGMRLNSVTSILERAHGARRMKSRLPLRRAPVHTHCGHWSYLSAAKAAPSAEELEAAHASGLHHQRLPRSPPLRRSRRRRHRLHRCLQRQVHLQLLPAHLQVQK